MLQCNIVRGLQHLFQNRGGASSCSCMPGAAAAAVPRNCSCCKLQLQLLRPFSTPPLNCRSNCSQLFPGCNCSCSPLQLRSASQTAVGAVPKNCSCYKLQLQLSQSCSYPGLSPTRIESASETAACAQDNGLQLQFHRSPYKFLKAA